MTTTGEILVGRNLTRHRSDGLGVILDNVDIKISPGDRVGLVGQSGSGKSSLFRVLVKLDPVERGEILYHGKVLTRKEIPTFRRHVVYLPQRPSFASGTVLENLVSPLRLASSENALSTIDYESWLDRAGKSTSLLEQPVDNLSGGEQQIVSLLRAIQLEPEVLLLDEPTAALDATSTDAIEQLVDVWYKQSPGRAYAWTSHNMDQIQRRCDRIIQLDSGRVVSSDLSSPAAPREDIP
jgi:putative ABC transport system ATP-binding protein